MEKGQAKGEEGDGGRRRLCGMARRFRRIHTVVLRVVEAPRSVVKGGHVLWLVMDGVGSTLWG